MQRTSHHLGNDTRRLFVDRQHLFTLFPLLFQILVFVKKFVEHVLSIQVGDKASLQDLLLAAIDCGYTSLQ